MDLPAFSAFSEAEPEVFYLGSPADNEFAGLADATFFVAGGVSLPVHSKVLSQGSRVLRSMFAEKQLASSDMCLESMFQGYSLRSVCSLLRFLYLPEDACSANFSQLDEASTLTEVVRLAHMLDAPSLLAKLDRHLSTTVSSASLDVAVAWTQLSEECHLNKLRLQCIHQLAHKLAAMREAPPQPQRSSGACMDGYQRCAGCGHLFHRSYTSCVSCGRAGLSHESLLEVLAACVAASRGRQDWVPSDSDLEAAGAV
ncbi:hypothetical protein ABPG75_004177 [Micractinium tetrahymenae]